jgi:hypothetical protein
VHCYALVMRWMFKYHRRMAKDLLVAADQVLFNFQNRHKIAAQAPPQPAGTSSKIVSLDLNTSGGESL